MHLSRTLLSLALLGGAMLPAGAAPALSTLRAQAAPDVVAVPEVPPAVEVKAAQAPTQAPAARQQCRAYGYTEYGPPKNHSTTLLSFESAWTASRDSAAALSLGACRASPRVTLKASCKVWYCREEGSGWEYVR